MGNKIEFQKKKINHIVHYTRGYGILEKIINDGFSPSYCLDKINEDEFFIPMISFCNIPLREVGYYIRYGEYGIGMSMDWAINSKVSPVRYIHEKT